MVEIVTRILKFRHTVWWRFSPESVNSGTQFGGDFRQNLRIQAPSSADSIGYVNSGTQFGGDFRPIFKIQAPSLVEIFDRICEFRHQVRQIRPDL